MRVTIVIAAAVIGAFHVDAQTARDLSGHWDRSSPLESFANTPGGTRDNAQPGSREAPFTPAGRAAFDANKPGYGPRRAMARNDPMGRCEPLGLVRNLVAEIVAPHATFEMVQTPTRIVQFFEYRHDWREIWLDGRALPAGDDLYPKWNGFSVGRWQGDELVVESVGFDARTLARQARLSALGGHARRGALPARRLRDARARHHDHRPHVLYGAVAQRRQALSAEFRRRRSAGTSRSTASPPKK